MARGGYSKAVKARTGLFIKRFGKDIARALKGTGIYWEAAVAQKCLESGYGDSNLAKTANNFGGIKGRPKEAIGTTSNGWAKFATPYDCFTAYARFLRELPRYTKAGVFTAKSPEEQLKAMVRGGYCADITPEKYVSLAQGAINCVRDICPLGRIENLESALASISNNPNLG